MTKRLFITIRLDPTDAAASKKVKEEVLISTKSDIFKLPVEAEICTESEFDEKKKMMTTNSRLRTRLTDSLNMSKTGVMATFKQQQEEEHSKMKQPIKPQKKKKDSEIEFNNEIVDNSDMDNN